MISITAIISKKIPKYIFRLLVSKLMEIFAPNNCSELSRSRAITRPVFHFIIFCFIFVIIVTIDVGTKNTRLAPCAICWSYFMNNDKHKISIVPPPIPMPETSPETIPNQCVSQIYLSPYFPIINLIPAYIRKIMKNAFNVLSDSFCKSFAPKNPPTIPPDCTHNAHF